MELVPTSRSEKRSPLLEVQSWRADEVDALSPVPPAAVFRVSKRDALRIAWVPGIFGLADFLNSGLEAEGREPRARGVAGGGSSAVQAGAAGWCGVGALAGPRPPRVT